MMNLYSGTTSARLSSDSTSSASTRVPRRRLSRSNRDNTQAMVDASPQPGRPQAHSRSSFLSNFSFNKNRTNSAPAGGHSSFLHTVRESVVGVGSGSASGGNPDEFGASGLQQQQSHSTLPPPPSSSASASTITQTSGQFGSPMSSNTSPSQRPGSSGGPQPSPSMDSQQMQPQRQLHPEIRSIVNLSQAHAHKIYFSGPLVKHVERHTDGKIVGKEEPWREVWAQLGGTTLSVWDMKEIEEASRRGTEVPPTYLNITDATIHVLGAVTMPGTDGNPVKYMNVITLTTAGLNLLLFSCPNPQALVAWTAALRLSAYEKSRLEELYTAHLLRMSLTENGVWKDPRSTLHNGRLEGWVKIRINGQTDWKRLWMVVQAIQLDTQPADASVTRKNRMSSLFSRGAHEHTNSLNPVNEAGGFEQRVPHITFYASQKPRDRKKSMLTLTNVTQVFAVYPERPELISRSTLIKMEGFIGEEELAGEWRSREGWLLMMPEAEPGKLGSLEMLRWLIGLHDAYSLYGRPAGYTWNPRDPVSLMFAYPVGPHKDNLFLDRELAESVDPREDRGSIVRQRFKQILIERMYGPEGASRLSMVFPQQSPTGNGNAVPLPSSAPPSLPPIQPVAERRSEESQESQQVPQNRVTNGGTFQLPPLNFDSNPPVSNVPPARETTSLSPITERTDSHSQSRGSTQDHVHSPPSASASMRIGNMQSTIEEETVLGNQRVESPPGNAPSFNDRPSDQQQRSGTTSPRAPSQLPSRFSPDQGAVAGPGQGAGATGAGTGGGAVSPTGGMRSPPLSPDSSISRYSQQEGSTFSSYQHHTNIMLPENVQLSPSNVQNSPPERDTNVAMASMAAVPPRMMQLQQQQQHQQQQFQQQHQQQNDQAPGTPGSARSQATFMSSPFSVHDHASRNKEQPPVPPSKSPPPAQGETWEPQYKHKANESEYVFDEPGALYYMQQHREAEGPRQQAQHTGDQNEDESDEDESGDESDEHSVLTNPMSVKSGASPARVGPGAQQQTARASNVPVSPVPRRQTPAGFEVVSGAVGTAALASVSGSASVSARSARSGSFDTSSANSGRFGAAETGGVSGAAGGMMMSSSSGSGAGPGSGPGPGNNTPENPNGGPRGLGRRPSGARALPRAAGRFVPSDSPSSMPREVDEQPASSSSTSTRPQQDTSYSSNYAQMPAHDDETVDALAALSFLEQQDASGATESGAHVAQQTSPSADVSSPVPPTILEPEDRAPSPQANKQQYRSSFAPSKQAAERKARSQAQQAAHDEAFHKPGRPNGKQRAKQREGGWESSEDEEEEEEEEEEDEDEVNTDEEPASTSRGDSGTPSIAAPVGRNPMVQQQMRGLSPSNSTSDDFRGSQADQRPVRTLPQIPQRGRSPAGSDRRYDQYEGYRESSMGRPQSQYPQYPPQFQQQQFQQQQQQPQPGAARQNIWSSVLDANRDTSVPLPGSNSNSNRDTFVQIETPAETMTKAFTPQGLLSAGMQDKQDRSAKRQEELARESGASLINVPNKPPPPQVGLLGAITAHERERKREGGMGATLTEREREKRLAEERQRRLDDLQRQQLEQQQQLAAQFGGAQGGGMGMFGGGGLSPQMTGMNPMMGGFGGYPQMMGPQSMYFPQMYNPMMANPQHMFAAQQAAQAYQQAMIAMSAAGSQVGGGDNNNQNNMGGGRTSPNAMAMGMGAMSGAGSPNSMGGMGYDPRMSMMSMGGMMPMMPGMGGMPGMTGMGGPMGMQMTGGSNMGGMDPRFSMGPGAFEGMGMTGTFGQGGGLSAGHTPPGGASGQQSQRVSSYNGSPAGSPAPGPGPANRQASGGGERPTSGGQ